MSLIKKISNIFKEEPIEEEYYELPTIMEKYIKEMNRYITLFKASNDNIKEPNITQFLWNLNNLSEQYKRFAEDYHRYNNDRNYKNHPIIEKMLEYKDKLQKAFKKLYNRFENVAYKSNIRMSFILERMENCFDFDDTMWNKGDKESAITYLASDPTLGKN